MITTDLHLSDGLTTMEAFWASWVRACRFRKSRLFQILCSAGLSACLKAVSVLSMNCISCSDLLFLTCQGYQCASSEILLLVGDWSSLVCCAGSFAGLSAFLKNSVSLSLLMNQYKSSASCSLL